MAKAKSKGMTGNCGSERHHTCDGFGRTVQITDSGKRVPKMYLCNCDCHEDEVGIPQYAKAVESAWGYLAKKK